MKTTSKHHPRIPTLLLIRKLGLPNLIPSKNHIQHALDRAQHLLIRRGAAPLEIRNHRRRRITLGRQILLRHRPAFIVLRLAPRLLDRVAHPRADRLRLHDVVGAVDFGEVLALDGALCSLGGDGLVGWEREWAGEARGAHGVGGGDLLFCADHVARALCLV